MYIKYINLFSQYVLKIWGEWKYIIYSQVANYKIFNYDESNIYTKDLFYTSISPSASMRM